GGQQRGPGGCAGTRLTAVPCPSAPTLPVTAPQPGGVPGGHCHSDYGAAFLLHKDGRSAPIQRLVPDDVGAVSFTLFGVTPADSGTYRCSYRPRNYSFLSSPLGDSVTLEVTPTAAPPEVPAPHVFVPSATHGWQCHHIPSPWR
uniref:Immunoglobulin domain-containing protein n=1 Tax=Gallus gallus TaxID=9031 RepID=A0A8V0XMR3_CHICK